MDSLKWLYCNKWEGHLDNIFLISSSLGFSFLDDDQGLPEAYPGCWLAHVYKGSLSLTCCRGCLSSGEGMQL